MGQTVSRPHAASSPPISLLFFSKRDGDTVSIVESPWPGIGGASFPVPAIGSVGGIRPGGVGSRPATEMATAILSAAPPSFDFISFD